MSEAEYTLEHMVRYNFARLLDIAERAVEDNEELYNEFLKHKAKLLESGINQQGMAVLKLYEAHGRKAFIEAGLYLQAKKRNNEEQLRAFTADVLENKKEVIANFVRELTSRVAGEEEEEDNKKKRRTAFIDAMLQPCILSNLLIRISLFEDILQELAMAQ